MGKIVAINISEKKGIVKSAVNKALLIEDFGIENDAHAGKWHRQVSLLAYESFVKFKDEIKVDLKHGVFGENLLVKGIDFTKLKIGDKVFIKDSILEITQIGKECHKGCEIRSIVGKCIMPDEGVFAKVIKGGNIEIGDRVCIEHL